MQEDYTEENKWEAKHLSIVYKNISKTVSLEITQCCHYGTYCPEYKAQYAIMAVLSHWEEMALSLINIIEEAFSSGMKSRSISFKNFVIVCCSCVCRNFCLCFPASL